MHTSCQQPFSHQDSPQSATFVKSSPDLNRPSPHLCKDWQGCPHHPGCPKSPPRSSVGELCCKRYGCTHVHVHVHGLISWSASPLSMFNVASHSHASQNTHAFLAHLLTPELFMPTPRPIGCMLAPAGWGVWHQHRVPCGGGRLGQEGPDGDCHLGGTGGGAHQRDRRFHGHGCCMHTRCVRVLYAEGAAAA